MRTFSSLQSSPRVIKISQAQYAKKIAPYAKRGMKIGLIPGGGINANSMGFTVEFFGTSSHAASQQKGKDAIAMAVEAYTAMEIMVAKEFAPTAPRLFNIGVIQGGQTNNIICNYYKMFGSSRAHSDEVSEKLITRVREICEGIAKMNGGEAKVTFKPSDDRPVYCSECYAASKQQ